MTMRRYALARRPDRHHHRRMILISNTHNARPMFRQASARS
jgi:hypothetical protein